MSQSLFNTGASWVRARLDLRARLLLSVLPMVNLALLALWAVSTRTSHTSLVNQADANLEANLGLAQRAVAERLAIAEADAVLAANLDLTASVIEHQDPKTFLWLAKSLLERRGLYRAVLLFGKHDHLVAGAGKGVRNGTVGRFNRRRLMRQGVLVKGTDATFFLRPAPMGFAKTFLGPEEVVLGFATPVLDILDDTIGHVVVLLDKDLLASSLKLNVGPGGSVSRVEVVTNKDGHPILLPPALPEKARWLGLSLPLTPNRVAWADTSVGRFRTLNHPLGGGGPTSTWRVHELLSDSVFDAPAAAMERRLLSVLLLALLIVTVTLLLLATRLTAPLRAIQASLQGISVDHLEDASAELARMPGANGTTRGNPLKDEILQLGKGIAELVNALIARTAAAQAAADAKERFLATMSHELRTPMSGLTSVAVLLRDEPLSDDARRYVDLMERSGRHLTALVNDILDFSKVSQGKLELESIPYSLAETLEDIVELATPTIHERGVDVRVAIDVDLPAILIGDPLRVRQIIVNIFGNAAKFTTKGAVSIRASLEHHAGGQEFARIDVSDTGIGIPEHVLDTIFDAFTQADDSTTRRFGGTGLGLGISRRLALLMGGDVTVKSRMGVGSLFTLALPIRTAEPVSIAQTLRDDLFANVTVVILAEDDPRFRAFVPWLTAAGSSIERCGDLPALRELLTITEYPQKTVIVLYSDPLKLSANERQRLQGDRNVTWMVFAPTAYGTKTGLLSQQKDHQRLTAPLLPRRALSELRVAIAAHRDSAPETIQISPKKPLSAPPPRWKGYSVLVVDDNMDTQLIAQHLMKKAGFDVEVRDDGQLAVDRLAERSFDVILMDCHMPVMDGHEATRELRRRGILTPVLALTADVVPGIEAACEESGMDAYLRKPIVFDELLLALESQLASTPHAGTGAGT
ncbi:MAG: response regulator [Polyangiaceae bacterium]|nr:response regulator [Polyangiaceae bacterium]